MPCRNVDSSVPQADRPSQPLAYKTNQGAGIRQGNVCVQPPKAWCSQTALGCLAKAHASKVVLVCIALAGPLYTAGSPTVLHVGS